MKATKKEELRGGKQATRRQCWSRGGEVAEDVKNKLENKESPGK